MATSLKDRELFNFNNQDYDFLVEFDNGDMQVSLNAQTIIEMSITESFLDWFMSGWITIDNPYDHFERFGKVDENTELKGVPEIDYKYRGDGRDIIRIKIIPKVDSVNNLPVVKLPTEVWEIYMEGVIYDVEELPGHTIDKKQKRFYFWEKEYHILTEKNIEFTTANVGTNKGREDIHKMSNDERSLPCGEALLELFKAVDELQEKVPEAVGETWVEGDNKSSVFYTSPANYKVIDDVNDILSYASDSEKNEYDICFLRFNRRVDGQPKQFSFEPLSNFFKNAGTTSPGKYQLEIFTLMDLTESKNGVPIEKAPVGGESIETNIRALTRNEIETYEFNEMAGIDAAELINIITVHSYHRIGGQFNIHVTDNTPEKVRTYQEEQYLPHIGPASKPRMVLNNYKKNGYNLINNFTYGGMEFRFSQGRNRILKALLTNGAAISFTARGQTARQTGRFITIRKEKFNDTDFDERLEGQYLLMGVTHNFNVREQDYTNTLVGTRIHRFNSGSHTEDDTKLLA